MSRGVKNSKTGSIDLTAYNRNEAEKRPTEEYVKDLYLDPNNPRIVEYQNTGTQASLQKVLEDEFDLSPIADSLYRNGYFWEEPLVCVREPLVELNRKVVLVVVEGNRRLAALKLIAASPAAYPDDAARARLLKVPAIIRDNRAETFSFIGFRHVTGIMGWESAAMAHYALRLVKSGHTIDEVASLIGDKTRKIARLVRTQSLIELAKVHGLSPDDATKAFFFSYLLTVTDAPGTREWLKMVTDIKTGRVKSVNSDRLALLWRWLYGSRDTSDSPVITESRQIHKLNRVLAHPDAVKELAKTNNLDKAFAYTKSREEYVAEILGSIRSELQDMHATAQPEGLLSQDGGAKEFYMSAQQELRKIDVILTALKSSLFGMNVK